MNEMTETPDDFQDVIVQHGIKPEFHVTDESSADWVLRKITEARLGKARVAKQMSEKLKAYQREEEYFLSRYQAELEQFARAELDGKKTKTLKLTEGDLGFRKKPAQLVVKDEENAMLWAMSEAPSAIKASISVGDYKTYAQVANALNAAGINGHEDVRIQLSLQKSVLNDKFKQGEIPAGCHVEPESETFIIK